MEKDSFKIKRNICYASFLEPGVLTEERVKNIFNDFVTKKCKGAVVVIGSEVTAIEKFAFYKCLTLTSVEIQEGLTSIGDGGFYTCRNLKSITLPNSLTEIGEAAFNECYALEEISLPKGIKELKAWALACCVLIKQLTLPEELTFIGYRCFNSVFRLEKIIIPKSVTTIEKWAFENCKALTICCEAEEKPDGWEKEWNHSNCPVEWGWKKEG